MTMTMAIAGNTMAMPLMMMMATTPMSTVNDYDEHQCHDVDEGGHDGHVGQYVVAEGAIMMLG